jgi:4-hydroxymandelate oxidase
VRSFAIRSLAGWAAASPVMTVAQEAQPEARIEGMVNVLDFEPVCKAKVPKPSYDYVAGGSWDEWTVRRNREQFGKILFRPRMNVRTDKLDLTTEVLGQRLEMPILVAPTGTHSLLHPDAEVATVKGAGGAGASMVVSTSSSVPLDKIAAAATRPIWFQLYAGPDREGTRERVERAVSLGCKAICWTVDTPYDAPRERDIRNNLQRRAVTRTVNQRRADAPPPPYGLAFRFQSELDWSFLPELVSYAKVPVLVKGILSGEDAVKAVQAGAAGVIVSNHGGRYLDGAPSTIEMLPEVVDAVGGKAAVLIDGGFRRGTDVLKALAIGAKAVLVGRPPLFGLGAFGEVGVQRVMEILKRELAWAMALAGRPTIASIDRSLVRIEK